VHRQSSPKNKYRLFCFPYGGGGASVYRDWHKDLSDNIEVCPVQLPGREERMNEQPITDIYHLTELLLENLVEEFDLPFLFFGHSFGSLIAFELARLLEKRKLNTPKHIFVSAFPDPKVPSRSLDRLIATLKTIDINLNDLSTSDRVDRLTQAQINRLAIIFNENGIVGYGDYLFEKEIMKVLLPIFSGDMSIVKSYQYYLEPPLNIPFTVFAGKQDTWVSHEEHYGWQAHTQKSCDIITFESSHMFVREEQFKKVILEKIMSVVDIPSP
jgi:surfactin synthase thioesterase subunit